ncbi:helix-turn-helix transcriptional regulator [Parasphingopyxis marina]|uniref:Helix-turn-helix domain-containing protein n=1 Tax=Parasphingopyxis marina TaxID=2761622 RepID=A0A842I4F0_9SPHN|nr:helix-turn-helix transcriptional regulator [Parasphingopyxis marina]MBC2779124.1 helix-turn-helix domain-containing protein [Parasphingopyxis marina]
MARREELSRFLKSVRARLDPGDLGLPAGGRRRVAGLRREEVALLSGMSVTWYTWFEQGREVKPSAPMLERLCKALKLTQEEREYLFALAQHRPPPLALAPDEMIRPAAQQMLDSLTLPAVIITEYWAVIGWNDIVTRIFRDYASYSEADRNLFKILVLGDAYREDEQTFRDMVRRLTARLKWDYSRAANAEFFEGLIEEMSEKSEMFREYWALPDVVAHFEGVHSLDVEGVGPIAFHHTSYALEEVPGQRLVIYTPNDPESAKKLKKLTK